MLNNFVVMMPCSNNLGATRPIGKKGRSHLAYRGNVPRFFAFWTLLNFYLWMAIWVVFLQQRGMNLTQIGTLDAVGWIIMAAAEVPTGAIADTYGRKTSMALGALLFATSMFAVTADVLSPVFLVGYLLWGASHTLISGADMAFLYDSLKAEGREQEHPKVAGRYMAVMQGSQAVAGLIGAWLATYDMRLCFITTGTLALIAGGIAMTFREPPRGESGNSEKRTRYRQTIRQALRIALERPAVRYQILFGALTSVFPFLLTFMLLQPYATDVGIPVSGLGGVVLVTRGAAIIGSMQAHRVAGWIGSRSLLALSPAIMVISHGLLWAVPSRPAIALFVVVSLVGALMRPVLSNLLNQEIPSSQRATVLSLQSLLFTAFLAVFEPAILAVAARVGIPFATGLSGVILAGIALPLLFLWYRSSLEVAPGVKVSAP